MLGRVGGVLSQWGQKPAPPCRAGPKARRNPAQEQILADSAWQLFDLQADPGQQTDVAAAHPAA